MHHQQMDLDMCHQLVDLQNTSHLSVVLQPYQLDLQLLFNLIRLQHLHQIKLRHLNQIKLLN